MCYCVTSTHHVKRYQRAIVSCRVTGGLILRAATFACRLADDATIFINHVHLVAARPATHHFYIPTHTGTCTRQWSNKEGPIKPRSPILQTRHKHTFKLHEMCQFCQSIRRKIIQTVATKSHFSLRLHPKKEGKRGKRTEKGKR